MNAKKTNDAKIAFLGTGQMGTPMATRLIAPDYNFRVSNRFRESHAPTLVVPR